MSYLEFNTDDDLHTVMNYKRQVERGNGHKGIVCVDIDRLAQLYEEKCKVITDIYLLSIGLPVLDIKETKKISKG